MTAHRILSDLKIATASGEPIALGDGSEITSGSTTGLKIGAATDKLGFYGTTPVAKGAALTAQLTSITHTAPGAADYAIQDLVQNTGFGFVTKDEGNTVLSVILNLQARLAQVEARLEAVGLVTAN